MKLKTIYLVLCVSRLGSAVLAIRSLGVGERPEYAPVLPATVRQSRWRIFRHGCTRFRRGTACLHPQRRCPAWCARAVVATHRGAYRGRLSWGCRCFSIWETDAGARPDAGEHGRSMNAKVDLYLQHFVQPPIERMNSRLELPLLIDFRSLCGTHGLRAGRD